MLHSLEFENFKSWAGRHRLDFGRLTGLFGANSSGKSSIIHLLLLLKQTVESPDPRIVLNFPGEPNGYIDLGSFLEVVSDHDRSKAMSYTLGWDEQSAETIGTHHRNVEITISHTFQAESSDKGEKVVATRWHYHSEMDDTGGSEDTPHTSLDRLSIDIVHDSDGDTVQISSQDKGSLPPQKLESNDSSPLGLGTFHPNMVPDISDIRNLNQLIYEPRSDKMQKQSGQFSLDLSLRAGLILRQLEYIKSQRLRNIAYLGPLRAYPSRDYRWTGNTPSTVGHRGDQAIQVLLAEKPETVDAVSKWMRKLGVARALSLKALDEDARNWAALIAQQDSATQVNLADVGFGVSQVLPVIVALLSAQAGSLVILEHPEIHLHPRVQSELGGLLIDVASAGEIQILVESHSEHLLARIQRRIAEANTNGNGLTPEDVRLYFCELQQGKSKLEPLKMQPSGVITNWPPDFFGDMLAERMALSGFYPEPEDLIAAD